MLEIGGDLHVFAATDCAEFGDARDLGRESHATRALDAAVHHGFDERAEIFVLDGPLVLAIARAVDAIGHRLVLQIALAALVADRAIQRVIDQQEFHHALAPFARHRRIGFDHGRLALRARPQILHRHCAGRRRLRRAALHLDEAHAAIAGDRQPLMEAETRHLGAGHLAGLKQRVFGGNVDFLAVDDDLAHGALRASVCPLAQCASSHVGDPRCRRRAGRDRRARQIGLLDPEPCEVDVVNAPARHIDIVERAARHVDVLKVAAGQIHVFEARSRDEISFVNVETMLFRARLSPLSVLRTRVFSLRGPHRAILRTMSFRLLVRQDSLQFRK